MIHIHSPLTTLPIPVNLAGLRGFPPEAWLEAASPFAPAPREKAALETTMKELRAKADIREAETQKLEVTNAELRRSLLLRAEQKAELTQRSEQSLRQLEAR